MAVENIVSHVSIDLRELMSIFVDLFTLKFVICSIVIV